MNDHFVLTNEWFAPPKPQFWVGAIWGFGLENPLFWPEIEKKGMLKRRFFQKWVIVVAIWKLVEKWISLHLGIVLKTRACYFCCTWIDGIVIQKFPLRPGFFWGCFWCCWSTTSYFSMCMFSTMAKSFGMHIHSINPTKVHPWTSTNTPRASLVPFMHLACLRLNVSSSRSLFLFRFHLNSKFSPIRFFPMSIGVLQLVVRLPRLFDFQLKNRLTLFLNWYSTWNASIVCNSFCKCFAHLWTVLQHSILKYQHVKHRKFSNHESISNQHLRNFNCRATLCPKNQNRYPCYWARGM